MKWKNRWLAAFLSFVLLFGFCIGDMQTVQAKAKAKKLTLNYTSVTMQKGAKLTLRITAVSPAGASKKVTWKSSNRKVVSVSKKGVITARKKGTATITAKAKSGGKKVKCKVRVTNRKKPASKVLVAYFSATGTTKGIAKKVAKAAGGTLYRITPAKKYSSKDLNYNNDNSRANKEQNNTKARPSLKGKTVNIKDFDTVFIAYPIWWGDLPRVMSTFAESYDFSGKTVIPLCTSHSSGIGSSVNTLKKSCRGNVKWKPGRQFAGDESQSEITKWVNGLGVKKNDNAQQEDTVKPETPEPTNGTTETTKPDVPGPTDETTDIQEVSNFPLSEGVNGKAPTITLNSGYEMPVLGIGTYSLLGDVCVDSVSAALKSGVRKIDTAYMYNNEAEVGEAVRNSGIPREEIFVTTKLYPNQFDEPGQAIEEALEKLNVGYIEFCVFHGIT